MDIKDCLNLLGKTDSNKKYFYEIEFWYKMTEIGAFFQPNSKIERKSCVVNFSTFS